MEKSKDFRRIYHVIKELERAISFQHNMIKGAMRYSLGCCNEERSSKNSNPLEKFIEKEREKITKMKTKHDNKNFVNPDNYRTFAEWLTGYTKEIYEYVTNSERDETFILGKLKCVSNDLHNLIEDGTTAMCVIFDCLDDKVDFQKNYCQKVLSCKEDIDCALAFFEAYPFMKSGTEQPQCPNKDCVEAFTLPRELDTAEAKELLDKAIDAGLMSKIDSGYKWEKSKALCAYFADRATEYLGISQALTTNEERAANWKPFETLFGYTDLKVCKAGWRKTGILPRAYKTVDGLF